MEDETILKKVVQKAVKNGLNLDVYITEQEKDEIEKLGWFAILNWQKRHWAIIFSLDFGKAFFGKKDYWKETPCTCGGVDFHIAGHDAHHLSCDKAKANRGYKFHFQQMVLKKNRLKYLAKFL